MSLILIDKPAGPTSHHVVAAVKRSLRADKVGHLGTLDPFASGLLPVMIGNTARLADEAMDGRKGYLFTIGFGQETDTLDPTGRVIATASLPADAALEALQMVMNSFTGQIEQVPPVYSALKMNGMPLYEHIRATGKLPADIETKRRTVTVHSLEAVDVQRDSLTLRVVCSKGTYVRSLARDIAKALNSVGTCTALRREMVEPWHINDALLLELDHNGKLTTPDTKTLQDRLLPAWQLAPRLPRASITEALEQRLLSGNTLLLGRDELSWTAAEPAGAPALHPQDNTLTADESTQEHPARKIFVSSGQTLFLCELSSREDGWSVQPRKRIH